MKSLILVVLFIFISFAFLGCSEETVKYYVNNPSETNVYTEQQIHSACKVAKETGSFYLDEFTFIDRTGKECIITVK